MLTPRFAAEPVNAPKNAMDFPQFAVAARRGIVIAAGVHAAAPPMSASIAAPHRLTVRVPASRLRTLMLQDDAVPKVRTARPRAPTSADHHGFGDMGCYFISLPFKKPCEAGSRNRYVMVVAAGA